MMNLTHKSRQPEAAANSAAERSRSAEFASGYFNGSPAGAAARQLVQMARQSPQASVLRETAQRFADSPHALVQRRTLDMIGAKTAQRAAMEEEEKPMQKKADPVQRASALEEEMPKQAKFAAAPVQRAEGMEEEMPKQAKLAPSASAQLEREAPKPNRTGLPDNLKAGIENLSGLSMDSVRVHYNSAQPAQLNALAYAQGTDIHVAPGQEKHLPHEAWHVAQQAQGRVKPTMQMKDGVPVNDDAGLEREADEMGMKSMQIAQRKCVACEQEDADRLKAASAIQRVVCNPTNRGGQQVHDFVVNHLADDKGWSKEYHVKDGNNSNRYADLVTPQATRVYEVKSTGVGAATAQQEATLYAGWINNTCNINAQPGTWGGRSEIDAGELGTICIKGHGAGGVTYELDNTGTPCNQVIP
jgi:hypothetical protein